LEESALERRNPRGHFDWWRTHTKAIERSKKQGEAKGASHYALTPLSCTTHCLTKGTECNIMGKTRRVGTRKEERGVSEVKLR